MPRTKKNLQPPLSSQELRQLYLQNPTPEHARTLWEVARLKAVLERFSEDYIKLIRMWPPGGEGRPLLLEMLKSDMLNEVREAWPRPRQQEKPLDFRKDDTFADLDDEHPEDRALMAEWIRKHGKPPA
ncbi:hypothetical protein G5S34_17210 [Herbaspirillum frisingense]|uniref:hypothetical protein n=1 Tax=Herbaspirillum frisingense TaxID=92645 RepID=UPI00160306DF|nr:hypothetical protein [Herbaspirillum frisingense]QNB08319.1 hypothetical protein G5S34_17210 [Herbaspirillum frisingense]